MRRWILLVSLAAMVAAAPAFADWDPGQPFKWQQPPDLTDNGLDVNASNLTRDYILADDFLCTETGPLTGIHIYGSWFQDRVPFGEDPASVTFSLSIHADIPASQSPTGYSMPGELLWSQVFQPGAFVVRRWAADLMEGWLDPPDGYEWPGDSMCWQYNFDVPQETAFVQRGSAAEPVVYWLDLKAYPRDEQALFGWKTSAEQWNDDAVWAVGPEGHVGPWFELFYPPGHQFEGRSIDLAFVLTGEPQIEEYDWGDAPDAVGALMYPTLAVHNGANHVILRGFHMGASIDPETDGQPDAAATGDDNDGNDDEDGVVFSAMRPGETATIDITATAPGFVDVWIDFNIDQDWADGIDVVFTAEPVNLGTTTLNFTVPPTAVPGTTFARVRYSRVGGLPPDGPAHHGEVEDYMVDVDERVSFKWYQRPDLTDNGLDVNATLDPYQFVLADDFNCTETGPITEIHVFGSWLHDRLPFGEDPRAVNFTVSFHADIPADPAGGAYSRPGELLWLHRFSPGQFTAEIYEGQLTEGWLNPPEDFEWPADTVCWLYKFHVDPHRAFHQRGTPDEPVVYWLDVQAEVLDPETWFGWKSSVDNWNDDAVYGRGLEPYFGPWMELRYPPMHQLAGRSIDLAFRLGYDSVAEVPDRDVPEQSGLRQNVPNPFNPRTRIEYVVPEGGGHVRLEIYDMRGRLQRVLVDHFQTGGEQQVFWDGRDGLGRELASGVYFYRLDAGSFGETKRMVLMR